MGCNRPAGVCGINLQYDIGLHFDQSVVTHCFVLSEIVVCVSIGLCEQCIDSINHSTNNNEYNLVAPIPSSIAFFNQ